MILLNQKSVSEICVDIAQKVKQRRLELNLTQKGLALRADVNIETYRKFERIGEISLVNLVKIAIALNAVDDFASLFSQQKYQRIEDVLKTGSSSRKRGNIL
ncbi:MAG: helix-turn-helix transcriptional regulator [Paludibacteraceae bacterium]|mgnify:FL=1|jgi:transcriptional regulator with XRE-family HTH domain|nr:helix-turn-helix transcriptional regulator [Paludibacteraceae bacterium]MBP6437520.1 helix-turn-helix transcriptional regulator [Paludibacteraceae bacterium]MBP8628296.1 helix-turn-helix transcriptional regulator [Paludibacteraceae bacterium]MBP9649098.1 helix-turn-helix transcriptional regulator [Paludibacteraceae bacterium]